MQPVATVLLNRLLARARLRHLQVLVQLAQLGSTRRAAEAVGMSQPRVTQILADLEAMLEVPLFHRHARVVRPTPACADLLPVARNAIQGLAVAADAVAARSGAVQGVIRLAAVTSATNGLLLPALAGFIDANPTIQVQLKEAELDDILLAVARGELDMAACRRLPVTPQGWVFRPLAADEMVIACSAGHPLARRRRVAWHALEQAIWLPAPVGSLARERFDEICRRFSRPVQVCQLITRVPAVTWWMLRQRPLLSVVPYGVIRHLVEAGELAVLDIEDRMPLDPVGVLLPEDGSGQAARRLADFLEERFADGAIPSAPG